MNTRYGSKATAPKMICGYTHPSLIDRFTLALPLNLEERGNIPSTRTMSSKEAKEQSGVLARIAEVMLPDLTRGKREAVKNNLSRRQAQNEMGN